MIWAKTKKTIIFITHNLLESVVLGNKVIVFTKRPGTVKNEIPVNYKRPRLPEDENLHPYFRQVIDSIKNEITDRKSRDDEEEDAVITELPVSLRPDLKLLGEVKSTLSDILPPALQSPQDYFHTPTNQAQSMKLNGGSSPMVP